MTVVVTNAAPVLIVTPSETNVSITPSAELVLLVQPALKSEVIIVNEGRDEVVIVATGIQGPKGDPGGGTTSNLSQPTLTYTGSLLTGIVYAGGQTKILSYTDGGRLEELTLADGNTTTTKNFNYTAGKLTSITEI